MGARIVRPKRLLTLALLTPGTFFSARSTRATQEAQVISSTESSIVCCGTA